MNQNRPGGARPPDGHFVRIPSDTFKYKIRNFRNNCKLCYCGFRNFANNTIEFRVIFTALFQVSMIPKELEMEQLKMVT